MPKSHALQQQQMQSLPTYGHLHAAQSLPGGLHPRKPGTECERRGMTLPAKPTYNTPDHSARTYQLLLSLPSSKRWVVVVVVIRIISIYWVRFFSLI